jgi:hypothetical protein
MPNNEPRANRFSEYQWRAGFSFVWLLTGIKTNGKFEFNEPKQLNHHSNSNHLILTAQTVNI